MFYITWFVTRQTFHVHRADFIFVMEVSHPYGFHRSRTTCRFGFNVLHSSKFKNRNKVKVSKFRGSPEGRHAGIRARIGAPVDDTETPRNAPHVDEVAVSRPSTCPCPMFFKGFLTGIKVMQQDCRDENPSRGNLLPLW